MEMVGGGVLVYRYKAKWFGLLKAGERNADRAGMVPDLILALASVAIVLSPCFIDAWMNREPRVSRRSQHRYWNTHFTS
jgi:hypothetical protein